MKYLTHIPLAGSILLLQVLFSFWVMILPVFFLPDAPDNPAFILVGFLAGLILTHLVVIGLWKQIIKPDKTIRVIAGVNFLLTIYFIPSGIALLRNRENKLTIFFLNLAGGWTGIVWLVAFVLSLKARNSPTI